MCVQLRCSLRLLFHPPEVSASPLLSSAPRRPPLQRLEKVSSALGYLSSWPRVSYHSTVKQPRGCALNNFKAKKNEQGLFSALCI